MLGFGICERCHWIYWKKNGSENKCKECMEVAKFFESIKPRTILSLDDKLQDEHQLHQTILSKESQRVRSHNKQNISSIEEDDPDIITPLVIGAIIGSEFENKSEIVENESLEKEPELFQGGSSGGGGAETTFTDNTPDEVDTESSSSDNDD
jgi:hypothetical protein